MIPVDQKVLFAPGQRGDCFRACVASILELPSEQVPHFVAEPGDWWGKAQKWFAERGLFPIWLMMPPEDFSLFGYPCDDIYCIVNGKSPRGDGTRRHAVVGMVKDGWNISLVHDPHPDRTMIVGKPEAVVFIVAKPQTSR